MYRRCHCTLSGVGLALLASLTLGLGFASTSFAQQVEPEACAGDDFLDSTNAGCNIDTDCDGVPDPVFGAAVLGDTHAGKGSTFDWFNVATDLDGDGVCDSCIDGDPDFDCPTDPQTTEPYVCLGGFCQGVAVRDTDWWLISHADMTAADTDGNGVIQLRSEYVSADYNAVTFFIGLGAVDVCQDAGGSSTVDFPGTVGGYIFDNATNDPNNCQQANGTTIAATAVVIIDDYPNGIVAFASTGECDGTPIREDIRCDDAGGDSDNDYVLLIEADATFETLQFTACGAPDDPPGAGLGSCVRITAAGEIQCAITGESTCVDVIDGVWSEGEVCPTPCNQAHASSPAESPGCDDPACCKAVCEQKGLEFCCLINWEQACVDAAVDNGCAPELGGPTCIATGADPDVAGYCKVCSDPYGSWESDTQGGAKAMDPLWGDEFNAFGGAGGSLEVSFTNGTFMFIPENQQRELLSNLLAWQFIVQGQGADGTLNREIVEINTLSDTSGNGTDDTLTSEFNVTGAGVDLNFVVTQTLLSALADNGDPIAVMTVRYDIQNNGAAQTRFDLLRHIDADQVFDANADFANDSVGTNTNGESLDYFVFQQEVGDPKTAITLSNPNGLVYYGAKNGIDPDGAGPGPAMGFGSDLQQWDEYGVPTGWEDYIAGVGYAPANGTSGDTPAGCTAPCDASIGMSAECDLAPGPGPSSSCTVTWTMTYGASTPLGAALGGGKTCIWDCVGNDGVIGIDEFLAILGTWGSPGPCDYDGSGAVGIEEFLKVLGTWGNCP